MGGVTKDVLAMLDLLSARDMLLQHNAGLLLTNNGTVTTRQMAVHYLRDAAQGMGLATVDLSDKMAMRAFIQSNAHAAGLVAYEAERI